MIELMCLARGRRFWLAAGFLAAFVVLTVPLLAATSDAGSETVAAVDFGGGEAKLPQLDSITAVERDQINQTIAGNIAALSRQGMLQTADQTSVMLDWPLAAAPGFDDPGYFATTNFFDHNAGYPGQVMDFACGRRTYDSASGYNHSGIDYYIWPFAWNKMAAGEVQVVAAAPGVIINRADGNQDQSCSLNGSSWNAVYVRHNDGSIAWYGHLKRYSLTPKQVGDSVAAGEYLGTVGSSGNSTGPHLHFELHDANYQLIDPYAGSCNQRNSESWWREQPDYYHSAVNKLTTGAAPVSFQSCPSPDISNEATEFQPGDRIYFTAYYQDQLDSQISSYRLIRPDGTEYVEWFHNGEREHYTVSYWWWAYDFSENVQTGQWTFEVAFEDTVARQEFMIGPAKPDGSPTPEVSPTPTPTTSPTPQATPSASPTAPAEEQPRWSYFLPFQGGRIP